MPTGKWEAPEAGNLPEKGKAILSAAYSSCRDKQAEAGGDIEDPVKKEACAKQAWGAVHNAGYSKNDDGSWSYSAKADTRNYLFVPQEDESMKATVVAVKADNEDLILDVLAVPFGGPYNGKDKDGDYFSAKTNTHASDLPEIPVVLAHGLDPTTGIPIKEPIYIGKAKYARTDDRGHWYKAILNKTIAVAKKIWEDATKGIVGASTGSIKHLVRRAKDGHLDEWPVAELTLVDLSGNVQPRNPYAIALPALKAIYEKAGIELHIEPEDSGDGSVHSQSTDSNKGNTTMTDEEKKAADEARKKAEAVEAQKAASEAADQGHNLKGIVQAATSVILDKFEAEEQARKAEVEQREAITAMAEAIADKAIKAMRNTPADNGGGFATRLNLKTSRGDDAFKAFAHYTRTGDYGGIRTGDAYQEWKRQQEFEMKTDYHLLEGTQYQGQEAVPTEVMNVIVQKRDPISIARAAKAQIFPAKSNAAVVPIEKVTAQQFGIVTIDGTNTFTTMTSQPLDKLSATIYLFTYNVPVDIQLIDDSVFNTDGWLSSRIGRGLGLTENTYFLMGTGSGQPQGAAYASTLGVTAAEGTVVDGAELVQQFYKLAGEYRDNVVWVMRGTTEALYRKWQSTQFFPFVGTGGAHGGVGQTAGTNSLPGGTGWFVDVNARVFNSDAMDAYAASKKPVLVGNFSAGYAIVERKLLTVLRDPYSEASKGIVNLWWYARLGGGVVDATALYHILTPSA